MHRVVVRALNEYLFLLSKLKCTSLTVSTCERVITRFFFYYSSVLYFVPRRQSTGAMKVDVTLALIKIII